MNFNVKLDDKKLQVSVESTNLKDILIYCKPKERLVLMSGILGEDVLVAKLINRNLFKFTKDELKLILISDFDVTYLKRNKLLYKAFYIEPLFEDLLTKMALYVNDYFEKRKKSEDMYEFIGKVKEQFSKEAKEVSYLKNDLFYVNFFSLIRNFSVFDGKVGFDEFADVNPKTMKLKIYYIMKRINKPVHYQELPAKIMDYFPNKSCKINTIHNELVKNNDIFVNLGLGRY